MDQVGGRVGLLPRTPALRVDFRGHQGVGRQFALADDGTVHRKSLDGGLHIQDLHHEAVSGDQPHVGGLATGFCIERGLIQDQFDLLALFGIAHQLTVTDNPAYRGTGGQLVVAGEGGIPGAVEPAKDRQVRVTGLLVFRVLLGPLALFGHQ